MVTFFALFKLVCSSSQLVIFRRRCQLDTGGKPSTWFPPGRLVEHIACNEGFRINVCYWSRLKPISLSIRLYQTSSMLALRIFNPKRKTSFLLTQQIKITRKALAIYKICCVSSEIFNLKVLQLPREAISSDKSCFS